MPHTCTRRRTRSGGISAREIVAGKIGFRTFRSFYRGKIARGEEIFFRSLNFSPPISLSAPDLSKSPAFRTGTDLRDTEEISLSSSFFSPLLPFFFNLVSPLINALMN